MSNSVVRRRTILWLLLVTPVGFLFKFYPGSGRWWFKNHGAGVLYEVFWILLISLFFPDRRSTTKIVIWVFGITSLLEILQLWRPPILEQIRSTFPG